MIVMPLKCADCGRRLDICGEDPMPRCPDCSGKMVPAGPVQSDEEAKREGRHSPFYPGRTAYGLDG